jgi:hypothetical protein
MSPLAACAPPQRYWLKARDGNFHPAEFEEPHVVEVLSRCAGREGGGKPPEAVRGRPAGAAAVDAAPLLAYALEYEPPARSGSGAAALPDGGASAPSAPSSECVLAVAVCSSGLSLDALAACDGEARGTLVRASRRARRAPRAARRTPVTLSDCFPPPCCHPNTQVPLPPEWHPAGCASDASVHASFLASARALDGALAGRVRAHFRAAGPAARILLVGHSIGGATAAVLALALAARHPGAVWWCAFGAPRPGDGAFASAFATAVGLRIAVKHGRDCVPKLPSGNRFLAAGEPLHCGRDDPYIDLPVMSDLGDHELSRYRAALAARRPAGLAFGVFPPFDVEALAPQRALASLANESFRAFQYWGHVADEVGAAVAAVQPQPPQLPQLTLPALGEIFGGGSSQASTPAGTPRGGGTGSGEAQAFSASSLRPPNLLPPAKNAARRGSGRG